MPGRLLSIHCCSIGRNISRAKSSMLLPAPGMGDGLDGAGGVFCCSAAWVNRSKADAATPAAWGDASPPLGCDGAAGELTGVSVTPELAVTLFAVMLPAMRGMEVDG